MSAVKKEQGKIFHKIEGANDKLRLFEDIIRSKAIIFCKGSLDPVFQLRVESINKSGQLICLLMFGQEEPKISHDQVICYVFIGKAKYYFQSELIKFNYKWHLPVPKDCYHLQRRENFRVKIQNELISFFKIKRHESASISLSVKILDVSFGGFAICFDERALKLEVGQQISGTLQVNPPTPGIEVTGIVRHLRAEKYKVTVGIEVNLADPQTQKMMQSLCLELYRDYFKSFNKN